MHVFSSFDNLCKSCCFHNESLVCRHVSLLLPFKSCNLKIEPKISDPRPKRKNVRIAPLQMRMPTSLQTSLCMTCICQFFQRLVGSSTSWQWPWNWIVGLAGDQKTGQFFSHRKPTAFGTLRFEDAAAILSGRCQSNGWLDAKQRFGGGHDFFFQNRSLEVQVHHRQGCQKGGFQRILLHQ